MAGDTYTDWTYAQVSLLWELARNSAPVLEISSRVGKSPEEVYNKAAELDITLPDRQSLRPRFRTAIAPDPAASRSAIGKAPSGTR